MLWLFIILTLGILLLIFCWLQNNIIVHDRFTVKSNKLTSPVRIVHLSDLHSKIFYNHALYEQVLKESPDIIVFTGDAVDRYRSVDLAKKAIDELAELAEIAPVYAVSGNHEYGRLEREDIFAYMQECGICVLRGEGRLVGKMHVFGIDEVGWPLNTQEQLEKFQEIDDFKILLSHFPHRFVEEYCKYDIDLTLCGHAHGGQFRFPLVGGVYSPGQGIFPKYSEGMHEIDGKTMVVSRGLGNSRFPLRLFNYPEVVTIDITPLG